ncbi:MAG: TlpA disulfide reductase family protein [Deltaproteobacteria bacterium]|jgi:peroxiredoxin|nr:TlpA disulfide reductase family protein [Deltaproteobacteria bacterium]
MKNFLFAFCFLVVITGCGQSRQAQKAEIGEPAPDFAAVDLQGNSFALADFTGKPVIIRFWSTECAFCRADTPVFNALYEKFHDKGLQIAYINTLSNLQQVQEFVADLAITFPVLMDENGDIARRYGVKLVPQTIIIDKKHTIAAAILGGVSEMEIMELLQEDLN